MQAAVCQGGQVLLVGTFDFGQGGTVFITNDVEICGERSGHAYQTKIVGGYRTFTVGTQPREWAYDVGGDEGWFHPEPVAVLCPAQVTVKDIHLSLAKNRGIGGRLSIAAAPEDYWFIDLRRVSRKGAAR